MAGEEEEILYIGVVDIRAFGLRVMAVDFNALELGGIVL